MRYYLYCSTAVDKYRAQASASSNGIINDVHTDTEEDHLSQYDPFAALAHFTFGTTAVRIVRLSIVATLFGAVAVYIITVVTLLHQMSNIQPIIIQLIMTIALIPAAVTRDLSFLAPASALGVVAYALAYVAIFVDGAKRQTDTTAHIISHAFLAAPHAATWSAVVDSFGVICFSMGLPVLTFQVQRSMTQPTAFMTVLNLTLTVVTALYVIIGAGGASLYANSAIGVQSIILSNITQNSMTGTVIKGIVAVTLILTAPLSLVPALKHTRDISLRRCQRNRTLIINIVHI